MTAKQTPITSRLVPKSVPLTLAGEAFVIRPFGFGQLPAVSALLLPLLGLLDIKEGQEIKLSDLAEKGGENLMNVLALAVGQDRAFIDALDFDEGMDLLSAVVECNKEQLTKKALPLLAKVLGAGAEAAAQKTQGTVTAKRPRSAK